MEISNWGNYPWVKGEALYPETKDLQLPQGQWIARGQGRCYGDSSLSGLMLHSQKLNHVLNFDAKTGILHCESGFTFEQMLQQFVPLGWFPPVTPGTKFVSMGGAIAADVHGKNHHAEGCISAHTLAFSLLTPDGQILSCSASSHPEIFAATFGGMGLTGFILDAHIQLKKIETSAISFESIKSSCLEESLEKLEEFESATYTMSWVDCLSKGKKLGRSVLMKGEHATLQEIKGSKWEKAPLQIPQKLKFSIPFYFPSFLLNPLSVKAFNFSYYNLSRNVRKLQDYDSFFYPLDAIHHWNRLYGRRGFTQYQFVIPKTAGYAGMRSLMQYISDAGMGSFLTVLKTFGKQKGGALSFPMEGYNLALDFKIEPKVFPFLEELDKRVLDYGGRIYLAKDARVSAATFAKMYPELPDFQGVRQRIDPENKLQSLQSKRLEI